MGSRVRMITEKVRASVAGQTHFDEDGYCDKSIDIRSKRGVVVYVYK